MRVREPALMVDGQSAPGICRPAPARRNVCLFIAALMFVVGAKAAHRGKGRLDEPVAKASRLEAAQEANEKRDRAADLKNVCTKQVRVLEGKGDYAGARAKLRECKKSGVDTTALSAEVDRAEKQYGRSLRHTNCLIEEAVHRKWTAPLKPGMEVGQAFLDAPVELTAGRNCGLADKFVRAAPKGAVQMLVTIDTDGRVGAADVLKGDPTTGVRIIEAAKRSWVFSAPKTNGIPVKTRVLATLRIN